MRGILRWGVLALASLAPVAEAGQEHPFLIVRRADFPDLRARASVSPCREIALEAFRYAEAESFDPGLPDFAAKERMTDLCGALALSYALHPHPFYANKLRDTLVRWLDFYVPIGTAEGTQVRWRQSAMVSSILALDVVHDVIDPGQLAALESMLDLMVRGWWQARDQEGTTSTPGVTALWALYQGDRALFEQAKTLYFRRLDDNLTPSGVYSSGPGYAWVRQGADRISKYALIDVLVFTGEEPGLYANPRLRTLHEWMYGGAYTPFGTNLTFGDTDSTRPIEGFQGYIQPYRAGRFSAQAGRNAAWLVRDVAPRPLLSSFVLVNGSFLQPEPPRSALWPDTAALWEDGSSRESLSQRLMGALWSPRASGSHSHKDVNAVHLCAYGVNLVRNSGYCGSGVGVDATFDWEWISSTAISSNTVTIDGVDHVRESGGGVVEGLTTPDFDYAASGSGDALENGVHTRSLLLVHGEPQLPGYFVLLDEVQADAPGAIATVSLHPDSAVQPTREPQRRYDWVMGLPHHPVLTTLYLGTPPVLAEVLDGGLCDFDGKDFVGRYLRADYATDANGEASIVTVVFPQDAAHAAPTLSRLQGGAQYSGVLLDYRNGTVDRVLAPRVDAPVPVGHASCWGRALHWRATGGSVSRYFARRGRFLDDGSVARVGFDSDREVSLVVRGTQVHVTSTGATVAFHDPAVSGALQDTHAGTVLSSAPGRVEIALFPGSWSFDLETGAPVR